MLTGKSLNSRKISWIKHEKVDDGVIKYHECCSYIIHETTSERKETIENNEKFPKAKLNDFHLSLEIQKVLDNVKILKNIFLLKES